MENFKATVNRLLGIIFFLIVGHLAMSQQQAMFTQYMFNGLALNPAYAGSHEAISATALSRFQWLGIEGAPNTHTFSIHSPIPNKNIGVGLLVSNDQIGVTNQTTVFGSYAYMVKMRAGTLALGLQGGFKSHSINYSELGVNDPNLNGNVSGIIPNFGAGVFFYGDRYYVGVSVPTALKNRINTALESSDNYITTELPHLFITAGMVFDLSPLVKLKPSVLLKSVSGAPLEVDFNANVILDDKVWVGISYRSFDAISLLLDLQVTDQLKFGYAYDYTVSDLQQVTSGSHELMLNYRFVFSRDKIVTPRYF